MEIEKRVEHCSYKYAKETSTDEKYNLSELVFFDLWNQKVERYIVRFIKNFKDGGLQYWEFKDWKIYYKANNL